MKPRCFQLGARLGVLPVLLVLGVAACTDRELPTAVSRVPDGPSLQAADGARLISVDAGTKNNPGTGVDKIWLGASGTLAMPGTLATAKANTVELTGGGIGVPHKAGKK
jgi:hypothetical protein